MRQGPRVRGSPKIIGFHRKGLNGAMFALCGVVRGFGLGRGGGAVVRGGPERAAGRRPQALESFKRNREAYQRAAVAEILELNLL